MKIHPAGADLSHVDGWTNGQTDGETQTDKQMDMTKLIVAFHNFVNTPNEKEHCLM